ncbi:hypothetical protein A3A60_04465 [Candidatus Curtissbacteria bacterium RIFCSPLOWO2_01_FULL_42_26]|uniref:Type II secretion system protein GspG C-terminal domain-containing protein n=1 Tax=Candidatus Curtissbacteria bacterium RIFCSPLOWO2_01_FULL_42_26 TaxID=1797729 RepID=A0A1F5HXM7_9BACT|nr:MAG: hypothetical protein A3A60_04465 [Candidatus Curtissbacteria bacterium RIFCSPLOWO2_01_FULL_42_26]
MPTRISILYSVFCIKVKKLAKSNTIYNIQDTKYCKAAGFTLIELLIVITIIGILATLILASFGGAQAKARDGRRKSDLAQIKRAMELAKSDCKGSGYYPYLGNLGSNPSSNVNAYINLDNYLTDPDLKYISSKTKDPLDSDAHQYSYAGDPIPPENKKCPPEDNNGDPTTDGVTDYAIWTQLERTSDADAKDSRDACISKPGNLTWNQSGYYVVCNN